MFSGVSQRAAVVFVVLTLAGNRAEGRSEQPSHRYPVMSVQQQRIRSPTLEVLMHFPPEMDSTESGGRTLETKAKLLDTYEKNKSVRNVVDVRSFEIAPPRTNTEKSMGRKRRETEKSGAEESTPQRLVSSLTEVEYGGKLASEEASMMPIRSSGYLTYPVGDFDSVDDRNEFSNLKRRRNDSADSREDGSRDKRTFGDGEVTTSVPYWKRKKENPQFITGRGSTPKGNDYGSPQHRSHETSRESHSLKNLDKPVRSNEIDRSIQDSYYSSTNRRTYSRQSDVVTSSTPKSVYDTLDYSRNKKHPETGRATATSTRDGRPTHEHYRNREYTYNYPVFEKSYYGSLPFPSEMAGRGIEYYHRTYEPNTGRIIYYANMPENWRWMDSVNPNFYMGRATQQNPHHSGNYMPPNDYASFRGMRHPMEYMRTGRSNSYVDPFRERDRYHRDPRFTGGYEKAGRISDDVRNKTYIIYDADDGRSTFIKRPDEFVGAGNRPLFSDYRRSRESFRALPVPPMDPLLFRSREYRPSNLPASSWVFDQREQEDGKWRMAVNPGSGFRSYNLPEIQLPLSTKINQNLPFKDLEKTNKKV